MFRPFKSINNESGVVLFIVLMTSIIIMILSLGILTQSVNESNYAQQQIDQLTCDQLKRGIFWNAQASGTLANSTFTEDEDNRNYTITTSNLAGSWFVNCSYDTFQ